MLFDKESPNLYREPLLSFQLCTQSLERIVSQSTLSPSALEGLLAFQRECVKQLGEVEKAIEEWKTSGQGRDRSPWGVSGRKPVFEVLWRLASGSQIVGGSARESKSELLEIVHDVQKVHPVVLDASEKQKAGRLFLIE